MKRLFLLLPILVATVVLAGCSFQTPAVTNENSDETVRIAVSIVPYVDLVEQVGGDRVTVFSIIPEGFSPEVYEPTPQEMRKLAQADIVVLNGGLSFETALEEKIRESNPSARIIRLNDALRPEDLVSLESHAHDDGEVPDANTGGVDPHTWLSPSVLARQIPSIVTALQQVDEASAQEYQFRGEETVATLTDLAAELQAALAPFQGRAFLVYHPAFGYFAHEFGLEQHFIEVEGKEPSAAQLKESIEAIRSENIRVVFLEKQFSTRSAEALAQEIDAEVVYVNPLAQNYSENLHTLANHIINSLY